MTLSLFDHLQLGILRCLPRNVMSRAIGVVASTRLPGPLRRASIVAFGRTVGVAFDEVRDPIDSFESVQAFFTRHLREGARPIDTSLGAVVAPCDGTWGIAGIADADTLLQLKGREYSIEALLGDEKSAARFSGGTFATFYLSPRDYHRFHSAVDGSITSVSYLPGSLWPVNSIGLEGIDGLFTRNERVCAYFSVDGRNLDGAGPPLCLVAVGATNVGSVRLSFDDLKTNRAGAVAERRTYDRSPVRMARGDEWGHFAFGSTIVLLAEPGLLELDIPEPGTQMRLGQRIGRLL